jgi:hypothetical protein
MEYAYTDKVKTIVADTYLAYTSDIDGAEAFRRLDVSFREQSLLFMFGETQGFQRLQTQS